MKAISIRQPWAWAILHGNKDVENRNWPTRFRGRVWIHASKPMKRQEYEDFCELRAQIIGAGWLSDVLTPRFDDLVRGAIVGSVEIVDCVENSGSPWFFGVYGFILRDPVALLTPVECSGALGFWNVPADVARKLGEASDA